MRFKPFQLKDYPYIAADLDEITMDLSIARLSKNAISLPGKIIFSVNAAEGMKKVEVPLDEEGYKAAGLSVADKICLHRIIDLLEKADAADMKAAMMPHGTQYDVVRAIRAIDQNFGGARFVHLARYIIDLELGSCLYPYMFGDLVFSTYLAYNKNVNRDIEGFMAAIIEFAGDFLKKDAELRQLFENIFDKSSTNLYLSFIDAGLNDPRVGAAIRKTMIYFATDPIAYRTNHTSLTPGRYFASFPKEDLVQFFETVHPHFQPLISSVFEALGTECDPAYFDAYQHNRYFFADILTAAPGFKRLDSQKVEQIRLRQWLTECDETIALVKRFEELQDAQAQLDFLEVCKTTGWKDVAELLSGQAFTLRGYSAQEFIALLPYMNLEINQNKRLALNYVRSACNYNYRGCKELLFALRDPCFKEIVRSVLSKREFDNDPAFVTILADRFECADALELKEWH